MTVSEKTAYLKGLIEGLGLDKNSADGKLWAAVTDILSDVGAEIEDLKDTASDFADTLDEMSEDLSYLEEITCDLDTPDDVPSFDPKSFMDSFGYEGEEPSPCSGDCESCGICDFDDDEEGGDVLSFSDFSEKAEEGAPAEEDESKPQEGDEELDFDVVYDVTCPVCGEAITFGGETLEQGFIDCPNCGERLEFEKDDEEE